MRTSGFAPFVVLKVKLGLGKAAGKPIQEEQSG